MEKKFDKRKAMRIFCVVLFILYMLTIIYLLLVSDIYGRTQLADYSVNLIPFREIRRFFNNLSNPNHGFWAIVNLAGNILLFIPFGALIRWAVNRPIKLWIVICNSALFSLTIELVQLFTKIGIFDVDDIILNTLGAAIGYLIYKLLRAIDQKKHRGKKNEPKGEKSQKQK